MKAGTSRSTASSLKREIYEAEFAREREAVEDNEAEGREVLSLSYHIRGLPEEDAERFVEHLAKDKEQLIRALALQSAECQVGSAYAVGQRRGLTCRVAAVRGGRVVSK
jgi:hypothetical protein